MQESELRKGPWLEEEDQLLSSAVSVLGERRWDALARASGLRRSGKSCRLRWMNYLRPNLKHGNISTEEEHIIIELHRKWGNKWSRIAQRLPGRTDNEIKNYWRTYMRRNHTLEKATSDRGMPIPRSNTIGCVSTRNDITGASSNSSDAFELLSLMQSPYEARLTEWVSNWQSDIPKTESENKLLNNGHLYSAWICEDDNTTTWDFSVW